MSKVTVKPFARVNEALDALREAEWAQFKREIGAPADLPLNPGPEAGRFDKPERSPQKRAKSLK